MGGAITCGGTITNCLNIGSLSGKAYNISYAGTVSNSYYLDTSSSPSITKFYGVSKTEAELKTPEFAATLGDSFAADANGGFPVLKWEAGDDAPPVVIPVCNVRVTLGFANASFKVPSGTELKITWKFVNDENDVPMGWQMLVNGMEPVMGDYSYTVPENADGITGTIPSGMVLFTTGKPDDLSFTPADADCADGVTKELKNTPLSEEQLLFELKFVDIATQEEIGTYGDGYHASGTYGAFTISATGNPTIRNYVTKNFNGYRIYMGTYDNVDRQEKTVHVGADGVIEKSVTMYVEINHSTQSDKHVQKVRFVDGDKTVLETTVPLKNAYVNEYTPIELDMTKAVEELKQLGYELDMSKTYTVKCNNYIHDPDVSIVEVTKCAHEHVYTSAVTAPTCTERGYTTHTCACGESYTDTYVDALGHKPELKNAKAATCTEAGYTGDKVCSVCGVTVEKGRELKALGHKFVDGVCSECGAKDPSYNPFKDISKDSYYYDAVLWAVANDVTKGTSATTFSPDEGCTRAQIVAFLYRAAGSPKVENVKNPFTDVNKNSEFYDAIMWAVSEGITVGTTVTTFSPDEVCTRAQIVTFLYRASGDKVTAKATFNDVAADAWYAEAVTWAAANGVTEGTGANAFSPNLTCTRAQAVTLIYRAQ